MSVVLTARAPGKVNLYLAAGAGDASGYHPLQTVFLGLEAEERAEVRPAACLEVTFTGPGTEQLAVDETNLAVRAARALAAATGYRGGARLEIHKGIPIAAGMAGGSADAALTLRALNALWGTGLSDAELAELARGLGADVPFGLVGGLAHATGRGDVVGGQGQVQSAGGRQAAGDAPTLAPLIHNDLAAPALRLRPELADVLAAARVAGALTAFISGSGPTVAALARDRAHAVALAGELATHRHVAATYAVSGPAPGASLAPAAS
ncbi:4-(cytidine 5'-diphospho)-2-C-methyl-D-erythritol kinase [Buchananella hordeovulneris]|uniref:GHMP family kinase ATP-binding protein n=1 Tax=Buchananella hordeovulneris TaxID=52770 RepID=UPI000F5FAF94|nr:4-(cytidine 5'-diphospho)-2-C-methyl-D-erythritol kinase [Buchananella hordeovulneris]RRD49497.1 4-(cytidine 5'-diphospho)-2-C-methyl-D-erythritol kinase [Buchananella hordeovulneris]